MHEPAKPRPLPEYAAWLERTGVRLDMEPALLMFGDSPALVRELGELVARGPKRATASLPAAWLVCNEPLPYVGQVFIVHDWDGEPLALIENTRVEVMPLSEVDAAFAYDEGEGDRTLPWWRAAHWEYFSREGARLGLSLDWSTPVICQRFRRLYPPETADGANDAQ